MIGINPIGMDVIEWTDKMVPLLLQSSGTVGKLEDPDQWQEWASAVILLDNQWQGTAPNPYQFTDWKDWAERFLSVTS